MNLALFDFDGTITYKDSLADFIIYAVGKPRYYVGLIMLSPVLLAWKLKLVSAEYAKSRLIAHFFKGWDEVIFRQLAEQYSLTRIDKIVRLQARDRILWHKKRGDEVVVVSASIVCWLSGWCRQQEIQLIATELEFCQQKLTGKLVGKNCQGQEKVKRICTDYDVHEFERIYAYGDSQGDKEMLALADEAYYRLFQ